MTHEGLLFQWKYFLRISLAFDHFEWLEEKLSLRDQLCAPVFRAGCRQEYADRLTICDCSSMARSVLVGLGLVLGYDDSRVPRFKQLELPA